MSDDIKKFLYSGYYPTRSKCPLIKGYNSGSSFETYQEAADLCHRMRGDGIGSLLAQNIVYIDIDQHTHTKAEARNLEAFMNIIEGENLRCIIKKTNSGVHCYFKDTAKIVKKKFDGMLNCGISAEIMRSNNPDILSTNGIIREIIRGNEISSIDELDEIPLYFYPSYIKDRELFVGEGERNDTLFSYIMELKRKHKNLSCDDCRKTATIINKYIFTEPLPPKEIEKSLSDDQLGKYATSYTNTKNKKTSKSEELTDVMQNILAEYRVGLYNGKLYYYADGYYQTGEEIQRQVFAKYISVINTRNKAADMLYKLKTMANTLTPASPDYILFSNCILNIKTNEVLPLSPDIFIRNRIPHTYNRKATSSMTDNFLDVLACHDKNFRAVLEEIAGECIYSSYEHSKVFFIYGAGSNGKTTFIKFLQYVVGPCNCASSNIDQINDKYGQGELEGKLMNIADEIPHGYSLKKTNLLKSLSGNSLISGEVKFQNEKIQFTNYATLIFSGNSLPSMPLGKAEKRRFVFLPFKASFDKTKNPEMVRLLNTEENAEYMLLLAVRALQRIIANKGELTDCTISKTAMTEYENTTNTVKGFALSTDISNILNHSLADVYQQYLSYCEENDLITCDKRVMSKKLKHHLYLSLENTSINVRVYKPLNMYDGAWHDD